MNLKTNTFSNILYLITSHYNDSMSIKKKYEEYVSLFSESITYSSFFYKYKRVEKKIFSLYFEELLNIDFFNTSGMKNIKYEYSIVLYLVVFKRKDLDDIHSYFQSIGINLSRNHCNLLIKLSKQKLKKYCLNNPDLQKKYTKDFHVEDISDKIMFSDVCFKDEEELSEEKDLIVIGKNNLNESFPDNMLDEFNSAISHNTIENFDFYSIKSLVEYEKIVKYELEEIDGDARRLPLLASDLSFPFKKELWYSVDELPPTPEHDINRSIDDGIETSYFNLPEFDTIGERSYCYLDIYGKKIHQEKTTIYLCKEARRGSATRGYISHNIRAMISDLKKYGVKDSLEEINRLIDDILKGWEFPVDKVRVRIPCGGLKLRDKPIKKILPREKEDLMDIDDFKKYFNDLNWRPFERMGKDGRLEYKAYVIEKLGISEMSYDRIITTKENFYNDMKPDSSYRNNINNEQVLYVLNYNRDIAKSKLQYISEELSEHYSISETTFENSISTEVLKSLYYEEF